MSTESIDVQLAEAVAAGISAHTYSAPYAKITAIAEDDPDYDGLEMKDLRCSVICVGSSNTQNSRGGDAIEYQVGIIIARRADSQAERNVIRLLRQEIVDVLRSEGMFELPEGVRYMRFETGDAYHQDQVTNRKIFQAKIMAEYRIVLGKLVPAGP